MKDLLVATAVSFSLFLAGCSRHESSNLRKPVPINSLSQEWKSQDRFVPATDSQSSRRLESLTWNSVNHTLLWDVSTGDALPGEASAYHPLTTDHYKIDMDRATMTYNGETRRFSEDEADNVRTLMDVVSKYAVESTIWWEQGQGDPVDGNGTRVRPKNLQSPAKPEQGQLPPNQITRLENPYLRLERALLHFSEIH